MAEPGRAGDPPGEDRPLRAVHGILAGGAGGAELDRLIHGRVRLGILSALAVSEELSFNELKSLLETTDGNLSVHARKLEEAGYIHCSKTFEDRMPKTRYRMTPRGRQALERYLAHMETLIEVVREG